MVNHSLRKEVSLKLQAQGSVLLMAVAFWWYWDQLHGVFTAVSYGVGLSILLLRALWHKFNQTKPWMYSQTQLLFFFYHSMLHILAVWITSFITLE